MRRALAAVAVAAALGMASCASLLGIEDPTLQSVDDAGNIIDSAVVDAAIPNDGRLPIDSTVVPDAQVIDGCVPVPVTANRIPPKVLIAVDKSASTQSPITGAATRIAAIKASVTSWRTANATSIEAGLMAFPTDMMCGVMPGTRVPFGFSNVAAMDSYLMPLMPEGSGPTVTALNEAKVLLRAVDGPSGRYLLLFNDGPSTCAGDNDALAINAMAALPAEGTKAYVVAVGADLPQAYVNNLRTAGGNATVPGGIAMSTQDIDTALNAVTIDMFAKACAFQLAAPPADPGLLSVRMGANRLARNTTDGWDYRDLTTHKDQIILYGAACGAVLSQQFSFEYGCGN